jgi:hypothetical protein
MSKKITVTLSSEEYELVRSFAETEERTLSNTVAHAAICAFENRPMERWFPDRKLPAGPHKATSRRFKVIAFRKPARARG